MQKLVNISDLFKARFIRHYATFYEIFKVLNLNEQRANEKKAFFGLFFFY